MSKEEIEQYLKQKGYALENGDSYLVNDIYDFLDKQFTELKAENERLKEELLIAKNFENKKQMEEGLKEASEVISYNMSPNIMKTSLKQYYIVSNKYIDEVKENLKYLY